MQLIDLQNITKEYDGQLLFDINHLIVNKGERIGIIGDNGAGKTTLLKIIARKSLPDSGTITINSPTEFIAQENEQSYYLSGGEQQWQLIREQLVNQSALLLLDEPTTNLDTNHIDRLIQLLKRYQGTLILVSHDRYLLDSICTNIWEITNQKVIEYHGNYTDLKNQQKRIEQNHEQLWVAQQKEKRKLKEAITKKQQKAQKAVKVPKNVGNNEAIHNKNYYNSKQKKLSQNVNAMSKRLENINNVSKPYSEKKLSINMHYSNSFKNQIIIKFERCIGNFYGKTLWNQFNAIIRGNDKIALIGANGTGKSTLINEIFNKDNPAIIINPKVKIGYFKQKVNNLELENTILDNISRTSIADKETELMLLASMGIDRNIFNKRVGHLSGGQKIKVSLAKILLSDINFLILDEPTNFLDIKTITALEEFVNTYEGAVLFVSHDYSFVKNSAKSIWKINNQKIEII